MNDDKVNKEKQIVQSTERINQDLWKTKGMNTSRVCEKLVRQRQRPTNEYIEERYTGNEIWLK